MLMKKSKLVKKSQTCMANVDNNIDVLVSFQKLSALTKQYADLKCK
jgi:hypothetical protein